MAEALNRLRTEMNERVAEVNSEIDKEVEQLCNDMRSGKVFRGGQACIDQVRQVRKRALGRYKQIKLFLNTRMIELVDRMEESDGFRKLAEKKQDLSNATSELVKEFQQKESIIENNKELSPYAKFQRYSNTTSSSIEDGDHNNIYRPVTLAMKQEREKYISRLIKSVFLGIIFTLLFAATDYYLLRSVFIASNMGARTAGITSLLAAIALDAPPYVLGYLISKRTDQDRIWYFRGDMDDPGRKKQSRSLLVLILIMAFAIILVIAAYLLLRALLFIGGGDINVVIHSYLENGYRIAPSDLLRVEYNSGDIISTFVPVVTSVSALAIGIMLSASEADYIKKAMVVVEKELDNCILQCDRRMTEFNTAVNILQEEVSDLTKQLYTFYLNDDSESIEGEIQISRVFLVGQQIIYETYLPFYSGISVSLRQNAGDKLIQINHAIQPHTTISTVLAEMKPDPDEEGLLDEIWVQGEGQQQRQSTAETIRKIEKLTQRLL